MKQHIKHVGTISLPCGDFDLFEHYFNNSRNYKITSVVPVGSLTRSGESFLSNAKFERWLERNMAPVQQALF
jgi:hypothetical protein